MSENMDDKNQKKKKINIGMIIIIIWNLLLLLLFISFPLLRMKAFLIGPILLQGLSVKIYVILIIIITLFIIYGLTRKTNWIYMLIIISNSFSIIKTILIQFSNVLFNKSFHNNLRKYSEITDIDINILENSFRFNILSLLITVLISGAVILYINKKKDLFSKDRLF